MPDPLNSKPRTAVLYARFSSDLQKDRSIDDQFALCRQHAERDGLKVIAEYSDRAKSGASLFDRDGLLELMTRAKERGFDAVVVESLDRISRDQEDLAGIFKRLSFFGIDILTVNEGKTTSIHVGIRGLVGSLFLADLGNKVRRGHAGRVREGKFPGAVTFGYDKVPGKPGERVVNEKQAEIIRRIFREYVSGRGPRAIANDLNRDGIPSPSGKLWTSIAMITGKYGRTMITNPIYAGRIVWNSMRNTVNPETGQKVKLKAPAEDRMEIDAPHLRIIDEETWQAAQAVRLKRSVQHFGRKGWTARRPIIPRNDRLLAGLLKCGVCGADMIIGQPSRDGGGRVVCSTAHRLSTCSHRKSYDLRKIEALVLDRMREQLTDPELIASYARGYHASWAEENMKARDEQSDVQRQLNTVQVKIDRLVDAIENSDAPVKPLVEKLNRLEAERVGLAERLRLIGAKANVIDLHPKALDVYRQNLEKLHKAFVTNEQTAENRAAFRNVVDSVVVHPTPDRAPYEVSAFGRLSAIMGVDLFPTTRSAAEIARESGYDKVGSGNPEPTISYQRNDVVLLGRWRAAA